jgi:hypothetical protein
VLAQNFEADLTCAGCGDPIGVGDPVLYGHHPACRRESGPQAQDDPVAAALAALEAGGRIALPKSCLRALALAACSDPVRHPDRGLKGVRWYGRLPGWSAERVERGLTLREACGLWLDALDTGRTPPVSHDHLRMITRAAEAARSSRS